MSGDSAPENPDSENRNVVMVTVDSLRADHCGFMGYEEDTTPTLDRMAEDGLVFENAVTPGPSTLDAMPAIFTGQFPAERDIRSSSTAVSYEKMRRHMRARRNVAERFSERGYRTVGFTANPWTSRYTAFDDGFDRFEDFMDEDRSSGLIEQKVTEGDSLTANAVRHTLNWVQEQNMFQSWTSFYDDIVERARGDEPYFLWIFLVDVHMPYLPTEEYRTQSKYAMFPANLWLYLKNDAFPDFLRDRLLRAYDDAIRSTDAFLDRLRSDLAEDDPLFVVTADHGEEFGEHTMYSHGDVYDEHVHVPLVVGNGPSGTVEEPFSLRSLPELLPRLATEDDVDLAEFTKPLVRTKNSERKALRGQRYKYVSTEDGEEAYDLTVGEHDERPMAEFRELGRRLVEQWEAEEREFRRVTSAAQRVAADESV
ncbi:sulfatase [Halorussus salilacus]|uniref:sulfatase n=1 Tax=Halorussus salilacus TaxID=2953750 RepID=UPI00209E2E06|nr:sulfatase [Halorussus salilacus]USZ68371.1 sulfatase [Halorussus salilacus]